MVKINDCCCPCEDTSEKDEIKRRALGSVQMIVSTEGGTPYYPDGAGTVTMPVLDADDITKIRTDIKDVTEKEAKDKEDITLLKAKNDNLQIQITAEHEKNVVQDSQITDITGRLGTAENDLISTEAVVAQHTADIANAKAQIVGVDAKADANTKSVGELRTKDTAQDQKIGALETLADSITKHLINTVTVKDGTSNGSIIVEIAEEGGKVIASPNYPWGQVNTFELVQGSSEGMMKGRITLSDGSVHESNEYRIVEVLESDIYVTAITLTPYPTTGKLGGSISYSNGTTQAINTVDVPTAPGVTQNINDLLSRMGVVEGKTGDNAQDIASLKSRVTAVETKNTSQDTEITNLKTKDTAIDAEIDSLDTRIQAIEDTPGIGKFSNASLGTILGSTGDGKVSAETDGTGKVNGWQTVKTDISQLKISDQEHETEITQCQADISANAETLRQTNATVAQHTNTIRGCYNSFRVADNKLYMSDVSGVEYSQDLPVRKAKLYSIDITQSAAVSLTNGKGYAYEFFTKAPSTPLEILGLPSELIHHTAKYDTNVNANTLHENNFAGYQPKLEALIESIADEAKYEGSSLYVNTCFISNSNFDANGAIKINVPQGNTFRFNKNSDGSWSKFGINSYIQTTESNSNIEGKLIVLRVSPLNLL